MYVRNNYDFHEMIALNMHTKKSFSFWRTLSLDPLRCP